MSDLLKRHANLEDERHGSDGNQKLKKIDNSYVPNVSKITVSEVMALTAHKK